LGGWGRWVGGVGVGPRPQTPNPQTPNPQSPIPKFRSYVSIKNIIIYSK